MEDRFTEKCHCKWHVKGQPFSPIRHVLTQRQFVTAPILQYLIENSLIENYRVNYNHGICNSCLELVEKHIPNPPKKLKQAKSTEDLHLERISLEDMDGKVREAVQYTCNAVKENKVSDSDMKELMQTVGTALAQEVRKKSATNPEGRLDDIFATSYEPIWNNLEEDAVKTFLNALAGNEITPDAIMCRKLYKCMEQMHWVVDKRYLSNLALGESMVLLQFAQSRYAIDLVAKMFPTGSYSTLDRTMSLLNKSERKLPANDIILAFDNNQVVMRTWMVKYHGKQVVSTVTAMVFFDQGETSRHQFSLTLPTALFVTDQNRKILMERYAQSRNESDTTHRNYRKAFLTGVIAAVAKDCKIIGNDVTDSVAQGNFSQLFDPLFNYERVVKKERCFPIHDLDCLNLNPNSYATVTKILDHILKYANDSGRSFLPIVMDGSPLTLCYKLLRDTYICNKCLESFPIANMEKHKSENHPGESVDCSRKYKKLIVRPGSGHIEQNSCKSIVQIFYEPFIRPIAKILGFTTENSLLFVKRCGDHHKTYNLLMILYAALSHELVYVYVQWALKMKKIPTFENFCVWEKEHSKRNLTYQLAVDFCFTTLHSLHLFRSAIRQCNDDVALAARQKLASIFYITHSTKYQEIICNDDLYLLSLKPELRKLIAIESSRRVPDGKGEGGDYLLENRNKLYKSGLPNDTAPTFENWLKVSRIAEDLEKLRLNAAERVGMKIKISGDRVRKLGQEVFECRKYIRSLQLLDKKEIGVVSFDTTPKRLNKDCLVYLEVAAENQKSYYNAFSKQQKLSLTTLAIFEDDVNLQTSTIEQITTIINSKIQSVLTT